MDGIDPHQPFLSVLTPMIAGSNDSRLAGRRILFVINVDWFAVSHRLDLIRETSNAGASVTVACADTGAMAPLRAIREIEVIALPLSRSGTDLIGEIKAMTAVARTVRRVRADVIHNVTIKPVIYSTLAARVLTRRSQVVNAVSGFGYSVESDSQTVVNRVVRTAYRFLFRSRRVWMLVQNQGAARWLIENRCCQTSQIRIVEGSGVDCTVFSPVTKDSADATVRVVMASRMLRDKGVQEFCTAADLLHDRWPDVSFVLAGATDVGGNPASYTDEEMQQLVERHAVTWLGHVADMPGLLRSADVFVLPSYHEGMPKALLEAAATGLPLVATDIDGCRPVVTAGENGELVPPRNARRLAEAIESLLTDPQRRARYAEASRRIAVQRFSIEQVIGETFDLYRDVMQAHK